MVEFLKKRLQVFVSSTYTDLLLERQAAVEAILTAGHIPAGMELFTSGDESQMEVISQWIQESDVYLLILGGRYGSIDPKSGKSYTHLEYEYAVSIGKQIFSCVITAPALEEKVKKCGTSCIETTETKLFTEFKNLVLGKMVKFWDDHKDIKIAIGETLSGFSRRDDMVGWVRPHSQVDTPALADEMARLSRENSELRKQITTGSENSEQFSGLSFGELEDYLIRKDLLETFEGIATGASNGTREYREGAQEYRELLRLGIIRRSSIGMLLLSDSGRSFFNKCEYRRLASRA
jgi:hypothetical protein